MSSPCVAFILRLFEPLICFYGIHFFISMAQVCECFQNSMILGVNNHLGKPEGWRFMKQLSSLLPFSYGGIYF